MSENVQNHEIIEKLKGILIQDLDIQTEGDISNEMSLLEDGLGLDSVVLVELIAHVEAKFGIQFDDQHLRTENFENLNVLAKLIAGEGATATA